MHGGPALRDERGDEFGHGECRVVVHQQVDRLQVLVVQQGLGAPAHLERLDLAGPLEPVVPPVHRRFPDLEALGDLWV